MSKVTWEDIDKLLDEAEETNVVYDLKDDKMVPDSGPGGSVTLNKLPSDGGQEIPNAKTTATNTSVVKIPQSQSVAKQMSPETKKNLMYFGAGLALFLFLRKK